MMLRAPPLAGMDVVITKNTVCIGGPPQRPSHPTAPHPTQPNPIPPRSLPSHHIPPQPIPPQPASPNPTPPHPPHPDPTRAYPLPAQPSPAQRCPRQLTPPQSPIALLPSPTHQDQSQSLNCGFVYFNLRAAAESATASDALQGCGVKRAVPRADAVPAAVWVAELIWLRFITFLEVDVKRLKRPPRREVLWEQERRFGEPLVMMCCCLS